MLKNGAALAADDLPVLEGDLLRTVVGDDGPAVIDLDDVAQRRARLAAYAQATRALVVYRFLIPPGATVQGLGGGPRDAYAQLEMIVGLTGGSLARSPGAVAARIPQVLAARFEAMAGPLVEAYLVSLERRDGG